MNGYWQESCQTQVLCLLVACHTGTFSLSPIVLLQSLSGRYLDESVVSSLGQGMSSVEGVYIVSAQAEAMSLPLPRVVAD